MSENGIVSENIDISKHCAHIGKLITQGMVLYRNDTFKPRVISTEVYSKNWAVIPMVNEVSGNYQHFKTSLQK